MILKKIKTDEYIAILLLIFSKIYKNYEFKVFIHEFIYLDRDDMYVKKTEDMSHDRKNNGSSKKFKKQNAERSLLFRKLILLSDMYNAEYLDQDFGFESYKIAKTRADIDNGSEYSNVNANKINTSIAMKEAILNLVKLNCKENSKLSPMVNCILELDGDGMRKLFLRNYDI